MKRGITLIEVMTIIAVLGILAAVAIPAFMHYLKRAEIANSYCSNKPLREIYPEKQLDRLAREYAINKGHQGFVDRVELRNKRLLKVQDLNESVHTNMKTDSFAVWIREKCPKPERQENLENKDLSW